MRFRLVPKSSTLDDLELLQVQIWHVWEATMKVDQHYQRGICCALTESTFQQCIIILRCYFWAIISGGADFSELRPIIHVPRLSRAYLCVT